MRTKCVYCSTEGELTKEHIVPSFLYKANPESKFGYNPKADAFISWEAQIRDVCSRCNNEHLSKLDSYGRQFYYENRLNRHVTTEQAMRITFIFHSLVRFLMKVTFNCLRFKGQDVEWVKPFSNFILFGSDQPTHLTFKLGVGINRCHKITEAQRLTLGEENRHWEFLPPRMIGIGQVSGIPSKFVFVRYVMLNNFCFYLIILKRSAWTTELQSAISSFHAKCPGVTFLDPRARVASIQVSSKTALNHYQDTAVSLSDQWQDYVRRQN
jgi:hypothetical protein